MFVWFVATSVLAVAIVFRSVAVDYRTVALGSLLPWMDAPFGGPRVGHSLLGAVVVLGGVMATTKRRRILRRRLLGIPIGMFFHLLLDGTFTATDAFWWPIGGFAFAEGQVPELRHVGLFLLLEVLGVGVAWFAWRAFGLDRPDARRRFLDQGRLDFVG